MADDDDVAIESEIYHQMKEQNASKMFQLETLFSQLKVSSSEVLACWLVGSRLWGTASFDSDWDVILVVNLSKQSKVNQSKKDKWTIHNNQFDAICYTVSGFQKQLEEQTFQTTLCAFLLPPSHRLLEKQTSKYISFPFLQIDLDRFVASVMTEVERDWQVAGKKAGKGMLKEAKKVIAHTFRMLIVACLVCKQIRLGQSTQVDLWGDLKKKKSGAASQPQHKPSQENSKKIKQEDTKKKAGGGKKQLGPLSEILILENFKSFWRIYQRLLNEWSQDWSFYEETYGRPIEDLKEQLKLLTN